MNNNGPKIELCGIPMLTSLKSESVELTLNACIVENAATTWFPMFVLVGP